MRRSATQNKQLCAKHDDCKCPTKCYIKIEVDCQDDCVEDKHLYCAEYGYYGVGQPNTSLTRTFLIQNQSPGPNGSTSIRILPNPVLSTNWDVNAGLSGARVNEIVAIGGLTTFIDGLTITDETIFNNWYLVMGVPSSAYNYYSLVSISLTVLVTDIFPDFCNNFCNNFAGFNYPLINILNGKYKGVYEVTMIDPWTQPRWNFVYTGIDRIVSVTPKSLDCIEIPRGIPGIL